MDLRMDLVDLCAHISVANAVGWSAGPLFMSWTLGLTWLDVNKMLCACGWVDMRVCVCVRIRDGVGECHKYQSCQNTEFTYKSTQI